MNLREIFDGKVSKKEYNPIFYSMVLVLILGWTLARIFYLSENDYFIDQNKISRQGNLNYNPIGGWIFIISTIIVGFLLITYFSFLHYQLEKTSKNLSLIMRLFGTLGGIGLIFVAITPEGSDIPFDFLHGTGEAMGFGGLGIALLASFGILSLKVYYGESWPNKYQVLLLFILIIHFAIMIGFAGTDSLIQWSGFNVILIWCIGLYLLIPEKESKIIEKEEMD